VEDGPFPGWGAAGVHLYSGPPFHLDGPFPMEHCEWSASDGQNLRGSTFFFPAEIDPGMAAEKVFIAGAIPPVFFSSAKEGAEWFIFF